MDSLIIVELPFERFLKGFRMSQYITSLGVIVISILDGFSVRLVSVISNQFFIVKLSGRRALGNTDK